MNAIGPFWNDARHVAMDGPIAAVNEAESGVAVLVAEGGELDDDAEQPELRAELAVSTAIASSARNAFERIIRAPPTHASPKLFP